MPNTLTSHEIKAIHATLSHYSSLITNDSNEKEVYKTLNEVYGIFKYIKNHPFKKVKKELKLCSTISVAAVRYIQEHQPKNPLSKLSLFEQIFNMQHFYLEKDPNDRTLTQELANTRDFLLTLHPRELTANLPKNLSDIFNKDHQTNETKTTTDPSLNDVLDTKPSDLDFLSATVIRNNISYEELSDRFNKMKEDIEMGINVSPNKRKKLISDMLDRIYSLISQYPLQEFLNQNTEHEIFVNLDLAIEIFITLIHYIKTHTNNTSELNKTLVCHAFLTKTLFNYSKKANTTEEFQQIKQANANQAQKQVLNMKGVLVCQQIINSSKTLPDEQARAQEQYAIQLGLDRLGINDTDAAWSVETYTLLQQAFNATLSSYPPIPILPLFCETITYLEITFNEFFPQDLDKLTVLQIDANYNEEKLNIFNADTLTNFQKKSIVLNVLELYYAIKITYLNQMRHQVHLGYYNDQDCVAALFGCEVRRAAYRYLLNPPVNISPYQQATDCSFILEHSTYYSPMIKALTIYQWQLSQESIQSYENTLTNNVLASSPADEPKQKSTVKASKKTRQTAAKAKKKALLNSISSQWELINTEYAEQSMFPEDLIATYQEIMAFYQAENYEDALTLLDEAIEEAEQEILQETNAENKILAQKGLFNFFSTAVDILKAQECYEKALAFLTKAWVHMIPEETSEKLHHAQKQKITLERGRIYAAQGKAEFADIAFQAAKEIAENNHTFCFNLLVDELNQISNASLAVERYQATLEYLNNQETSFIDPYYVSDFFTFYSKLAEYCYTTGRESLKSKLNTRLHQQAVKQEQKPDYIDQGIYVLRYLIAYAEKKAPTYLLNLQLQLITMYKNAYSDTRKKTYATESALVLANALKIAHISNDESLIQRVASAKWQAIDIIDSSSSLKQEALIEETNRHQIETINSIRDSIPFGKNTLNTILVKIAELQSSYSDPYPAFNYIMHTIGSLQTTDREKQHEENKLCSNVLLEKASEIANNHRNQAMLKRVDLVRLTLNDTMNDSMLVDCIQKITLITDIHNIINIFCVQYPDIRGRTSLKEEQHIALSKHFSDILVSEQSLLDAQIMLFRDQFQDINTLSIDALIQLHNAERHYAARSVISIGDNKQLSDITKITWGNTQELESVLTTQLGKIQLLEKLIQQHKDANTSSIEKITFLKCVGIHQLLLPMSVIKNELQVPASNASPPLNSVWFTLHYCFKLLDSGNLSRSYKGHIHFIVGKLADWTLEQIKESIYPEMQSISAIDFIRHFFNELKKICKYHYQQAEKANIPGTEDASSRRQSISNRELPPNVSPKERSQEERNPVVALKR